MWVGAYVQTHHNKLKGREVHGEQNNKKKDVNVDLYRSLELWCSLLVCARQVLINCACVCVYVHV